MAPSYGNEVLFSMPVLQELWPKRLYLKAPARPRAPACDCSVQTLPRCAPSVDRLHRYASFKQILTLTDTSFMLSPFFLSTDGLFSGVVTDWQ